MVKKNPTCGQPQEEEKKRENSSSGITFISGSIWESGFIYLENFVSQISYLRRKPEQKRLLNYITNSRTEA